MCLPDALEPVNLPEIIADGERGGEEAAGAGAAGGGDAVSLPGGFAAGLCGQGYPCESKSPSVSNAQGVEKCQANTPFRSG